MYGIQKFLVSFVCVFAVLMEDSSAMARRHSTPAGSPILGARAVAPGSLARDKPSASPFHKCPKPRRCWVPGASVTVNCSSSVTLMKKICYEEELTMNVGGTLVSLKTNKKETECTSYAIPPRTKGGWEYEFRLWYLRVGGFCIPMAEATGKTRYVDASVTALDCKPSGGML